MANDPPPQPPPSRWQKYFSARNEQQGALIEAPAVDVHPAPPPPLADVRRRASDDEALFIECMPNAARRRIAFNVVERNCRDAFARGKEGLALFMQVRKLVERAQVEEAVNEFDKRFAPMLDQEVVAERLRNP